MTDRNASFGEAEKLLPCRKCGATDISWWDGRGTQADLICNQCGQEEGVQVIDLFEGDAKDRPLLDADLRYPPDLVAKTNAHLAAEWNTRAAISPSFKDGIEAAAKVAGDVELISHDPGECRAFIVSSIRALSSEGGSGRDSPHEA